MSQSQLASCPPEFAWAKNSDNLDPCKVASLLILRCDNSGQFKGLLPLQPGNVYPVPTNDSANKCTCSSVVYALVSVCSVCQNVNYSSWPDWSTSCSTVYTSNFPLSTNISIPQWTSFDVQTEPTFDIALAQNSTSSNVTTTPSIPEVNKAVTVSTSNLETTSSSTPTSQPQSSASINSPIAEALTSSYDPLPTSSESTSTGIIPVTQASDANPTTITVVDQSQSSSEVSAVSTKKGSNTGAVAGSTVAGIIILLIIGGLTFWWIRRYRRSRMAPSAAYIAAYGTARPPTNMSQRPYQGRTTSPFVTRAEVNAPYYDEDFRASAYSDTRQS